MPLKPVNIEELIGNNLNVYESINIIAKRSRQINDEIRSELLDKLSLFSELVESEEENEVNHEQARISIEYELKEKPTVQAIEEKLDNDIDYHYK